MTEPVEMIPFAHNGHIEYQCGDCAYGFGGGEHWWCGLCHFYVAQSERLYDAMAATFQPVIACKGEVRTQEAWDAHWNAVFGTPPPGYRWYAGYSGYYVGEIDEQQPEGSRVIDPFKDEREAEDERRGR